jgi:hypothetical protein
MRWYSEAVGTLELVNRQGWGVWANDPAVPSLGIPAVIITYTYNIHAYT